MPDKTEIAVGLDAGSAQTRCLILAMEDGRLAYLGHGEVESTGWSKSRVVDQKALTACVQSAVRRAEMEARVPVDALVVGTGWPEFRTLDFNKIKHLLKRPLIVDTKNLLDSSRLRALGFQYVGIGRG